MTAPTTNNLDALLADAFKAHEGAEKAWQALSVALPAGNERTWASEVYENIRRATNDTSVKP